MDCTWSILVETHIGKNESLFESTSGAYISYSINFILLSFTSLFLSTFMSTRLYYPVILVIGLALQEALVSSEWYVDNKQLPEAITVIPLYAFVPNTCIMHAIPTYAVLHLYILSTCCIRMQHLPACLALQVFTCKLDVWTPIMPLFNLSQESDRYRGTIYPLCSCSTDMFQVEVGG